MKQLEYRKIKQIAYLLTIIFFTACGQNNRNSVEKSMTLLSDTLPLDTLPLDTLIVNNYILFFEDADDFEKTDIFGDLDYRNKLTDTVKGSLFNKFRKIETYLTKYFNEYFYLTDSTLVLKLDNGDTMSFGRYVEEKHWNDVNFIGYIFEHYFDKIDYYLLFIHYYEGNSWMLINRKNGFKKAINGLPYISKDNKKIIAINSDLYAGYSFNGIELYTILEDSLKTEFSKETKWGALDVKWINENEFLIKREHSGTDRITDYKRVFIKKKN